MEMHKLLMIQNVSLILKETSFSFIMIWFQVIFQTDIDLFSIYSHGLCIQRTSTPLTLLNPSNHEKTEVKENDVDKISKFIILMRSTAASRVLKTASSQFFFSLYVNKHFLVPWRGVILTNTLMVCYDLNCQLYVFLRMTSF